MKRVVLLIIISFFCMVNASNRKLIFYYNYDDDGSYFYFDEGYVIQKLFYDNKIKLFDLERSLIDEFGGKGYGPGEFLSIINPKIHDNNLFIFDKSLYRVTKYDMASKEFTTFKSQPYLRFPSDYIFKNNFLYIFGPNRKNFYDPRDECYLFTKCVIIDNEIITKNDLLNVGEELSQYDSYKKYIPKSWHVDSRLKSEVPTGDCFVTESTDSFIIVYPFIGDFFIFNYKLEKVHRVPIIFPGYENPTGKNYYKIWKRYSENQEDFMSDYLYRPSDISYDAIKQQYRIIYTVPKTNRKENRRFEVIFDSNFQYVSKENLDDGIWRYSKHDGKIYMLNQNREEMTVKIYELEK